jgi:hypothetical protein
VTPVEALERIAELLMRGSAPSSREQTVRRAAREISTVADDEQLEWCSSHPTP